MRLSSLLASTTAVGGVLVVSLGVWLYSATSADDFARTEEVSPGGRLEVDLELGDVSIAADDEASVRIAARSGSWPWRADFTVSRDGETLRLRGRDASAGSVATAVEWLLWPFRLDRVEVRVRLPRRFSVTVRSGGGHVAIAGLEGDVGVETSGGRIDVERVEGRVDVMTSGGRIQVSAIRGDLRAETSGGRIRAKDVRGSVFVRTTGGGIDVREAGGPITAETGGGRIFASFTGAPAGNLETRGGRIEVRFPRASGVDLEAATSGGRVELDEALSFRGESEPSRASGAINGGGAPLRVRTSGGGIQIEGS